MLFSMSVRLLLFCAVGALAASLNLSAKSPRPIEPVFIADRLKLVRWPAFAPVCRPTSWFCDSRLRVLNCVLREMLLTSSSTCAISLYMAFLAVGDSVSLAACTVSSRARDIMSPTSFIAPSAVRTMDTPSCVLRIAWSRLRIWLNRASDIAKPAASSLARLMRLPVAKRSLVRFC